jgi:hypothetical protein
LPGRPTRLRLLGQPRGRRRRHRRPALAAAEIARREHLELDPDVRWLLTDAGRDALARATAEAWLFGTGPSVAEASTLAVAA